VIRKLYLVPHTKYRFVGCPCLNLLLAWSGLVLVSHDDVQIFAMRQAMWSGYMHHDQTMNASSNVDIVMCDSSAYSPPHIAVTPLVQMKNVSSEQTWDVQETMSLQNCLSADATINTMPQSMCITPLKRTDGSANANWSLRAILEPWRRRSNLTHADAFEHICMFVFTLKQ
jgi:hypothetical protein